MKFSTSDEWSQEPWIDTTKTFLYRISACEFHNITMVRKVLSRINDSSFDAFYLGTCGNCGQAFEINPMEVAKIWEQQNGSKSK